ncbi:MAG: L,D-transpeptidase [Pseudomonadota bacterium]
MIFKHGKLIVGTIAVAMLGMVMTSPADARKMYIDEHGNWTLTAPKNMSKRSRSNASPIPRQVVSFSGKHSKGTILIDTSERRLYHVLGGGKAMKYAIGVGREGFTWTGRHRVTRKAEWPGWTPPPAMIARERRKGRILPAHMPGGPENPLGARALYIGSTLYRIHGTNDPRTIGHAVSSGCIRMANDDVIHLYENASVGSRIVVQH